MKRLCLGLVILASGLLLAPAGANAAYDTFGTCDPSVSETPSHLCHSGEPLGAFFESDLPTVFELCIEFDGDEYGCTEPEAVDANVPFGWKIEDLVDGDYVFRWYVSGTEVGSPWSIRVEPAPPPSEPSTPPATTAPTVVTPPPPVAAPLPSAACTKAKRRVLVLKGRLKQASGLKAKTKLRAKLKLARAAVKRLC